MIKKISAMLIALTMSVCVFTGCANSSSSDADSSSQTESSAIDDQSSGDQSGDESDASGSGDSSQVSEITAQDPSLTLDGKKIDIDNFVMCTIDGSDIDFMTFRYFYFYTVTQFQMNYGADLDVIKNTPGGFEDLLNETIENIKNNRSIVDKLTKENGITLTDDDKKKVQEDFEDTKKQFDSEEEFKVQLKNAYLTEELYKTNLEYAQLAEKINSTLFTNDGKYATKRADFKNIVKDTTKYASEMHIMIPFYTGAELDEETQKQFASMTLENKLTAKQQAYASLDEAGKQKAKENAKAQAEEALKKALAGEDFSTLMTQYGYDTALATNEKGYYFSKDTTSFPTEIVEKTFTLKENEIASDVLEHELYGYFVVKRMPVDETYVDSNIDALIGDYDTALINKLITEINNDMQVKYCEGWSKLTADSIT